MAHVRDWRQRRSGFGAVHPSARSSKERKFDRTPVIIIDCFTLSMPRIAPKPPRKFLGPATTGRYDRSDARPFDDAPGARTYAASLAGAGDQGIVFARVTVGADPAVAEATVFELVVIFILPEKWIIVGAEDPSVRAGD